MKHRLGLSLLIAAHRVRNRLSRGQGDRVPMPIVVGAPRSGTTLLRMMLDSHPELAVPPETGFLVPALRIWGPSVYRRRAFFRLVTGSPAWGDHGVPADDFWRQLESVEPFSVSEGLRCFYRTYAARFGKARWGDKTPIYGLYILGIEQLLPEARFIHLIRDGRDVALSLREVWFSPSRDMRELARYWRRHVSTTRAQGGSCRHYLEVRFEDLVRDPASTLKGICAFCGLSYDPRMTDYHLRAPERLREHKARRGPDGSVLVSHEQRLVQQRMTMRPPDLARVGTWRKGMLPSERRAFEDVAGRFLGELGYETH